MWSIFKKIEPEVEVYKFFLYCKLQFWNIFTKHDLTINQKRHKCYKIYTEFGQYIHDKYGQKYLDFFEEKIYENGWINKDVDKELKK